MREPINGAELTEAIAPWRLDLRQETASTNADAVEAARAGQPEGLVVLAESQTAGRGRLGRAWVSPPRAGLAMSILLRPVVEMPRWGWLPLLAGLALAEAVTGLAADAGLAEPAVAPGSEVGRNAGWPASAALEVGLKWPNDLLVGGRKCAGILVEAVSPGAAVVGIGLNVSLTEDELPTTPTGLPATSLALAGQQVDRTRLAIALIRRFKQRYEDWPATDPRQAYLDKCLTLGRDVRIILPGDSEISGKATTVDGDGRLIVRTPGGELCPVAAGDVTHVR